MPIEIKELHIKINVDNDANKSQRQNKPQSNKETIVAECVEQVMQIITTIKER